jgi:hypothetical protein
MTEESEDIGLSANDAQLIKSTIISTTISGTCQGAFEMAGDLIEAFKMVDEQVFLRVEKERELEKLRQKARLETIQPVGQALHS